MDEIKKRRKVQTCLHEQHVLLQVLRMLAELLVAAGDLLHLRKVVCGMGGQIVENKETQKENKDLHNVAALTITRPDKEQAVGMWIDVSWKRIAAVIRNDLPL